MYIHTRSPRVSVVNVTHSTNSNTGSCARTFCLTFLLVRRRGFQKGKGGMRNQSLGKMDDQNGSRPIASGNPSAERV